MKRHPPRRPSSYRARLPALLASVLAVCALLLAACSAVREGPTITVASADGPQDQLLGQVALVMLREHGYPTADKVGLGETRAVRAALAGVRADLAWAYTGEAWTDALGHDLPVTDADSLFRSVAQEDLANGLTWLGPSSVERRLALVVTADLGTRAGLRSIGQLPGYRSSVDPNMRLCAPEELQASPQGLAGLERVYGLRFAAGCVVTMPAVEGYEALSNGDCDCALGYSDDTAVWLSDLQVLEDERGFFAASSLSLVVRNDILAAYPDLEALLDRCAACVTHEEMALMMRQVLEQDVEPLVAARSFLRRANLLPGSEENVDGTPAT